MKKQPIVINISKLIGSIRITSSGPKLKKEQILHLQEQVVSAILTAVECAQKAISEGLETQQES